MQSRTIIYPALKEGRNSKPGPWFALQFHLDNRKKYPVPCTTEAAAPKYSYDLFYIPALKKTARGEKHQNADFGIHFFPDYLRQLTPDFPALADFLGKINYKAICRFCDRPIAANPCLLSIINDILHCRFSGTTKNIYIESKVSELLILSLEQACRQLRDAAFILRPQEAERIREARTLMLQRMDKPYSLAELSRKIAINITKLKKGFRQLYGTTVFGYFRNEQMKQAQHLLRDTGMPVHEIAFATGYKNVSNFSIAFKRHFGYAPSYLRKGGYNKE